MSVAFDEAPFVSFELTQEFKAAHRDNTIEIIPMNSEGHIQPAGRCISLLKIERRDLPGKLFVIQGLKCGFGSLVWRVFDKRKIGQRIALKKPIENFAEAFERPIARCLAGAGNE